MVKVELLLSRVTPSGRLDPSLNQVKLVGVGVPDAEQFKVTLV